MWSSRPVTRILIFYVVGILLSSFFPQIGGSFITILAIVLVLLAVYTYLVTLNPIHKFNWVVGVVSALLVITTSITISIKNPDDNTICTNYNEKISYLGNVISNPIINDKTTKATIEVITAVDDTCLLNNGIVVLCYFENDTNTRELNYGDIILFVGKLNIPDGPKNPKEFDYQQYLRSIGINYTIYVGKQNWKCIGIKPRNALIAYATQIRNSLLITLSKNGFKGNNFDIAAAILLGYDDNIENELRKDFITAGAMHILCVSGLHVGIIYLVFSYMLSFLPATRINNILKAIILLFVVWVYAIITGLSPSVQRAGIMISFFIINNVLKRNLDSYNTLAASALVILIYNPQLLFNVGFQLSYAAVLGIITFHQPIYRLLYIKNKIIDGIWSITVLSFSAQLATFPIAIYYFHFFPPWFWLTNLATFPLSFLIIVSGLFFVITSWIPWISLVSGKMVLVFVFVLNQVVKVVDYLPMPGIENIYMSSLLLFTVYSLLLLLYSFLLNTKIKLLLPICISLLIITCLCTLHNFNVLSQKKIVIYSVVDHPVYEFIEGRNQIILTDSIIIANPGKIDFQIKNSRAYWGLGNKMTLMRECDESELNLKIVSHNFINFHEIKIMIIDTTITFHKDINKLNVDLLIFSGRAKTYISGILNSIDADKVIIDSTVPPWESKKIIAACREKSIPIHELRKNGSLIINL